MSCQPFDNREQISTRLAAADSAGEMLEAQIQHHQQRSASRTTRPSAKAHQHDGAGAEMHKRWLQHELARESLRADTAALNLAQLLEDKQLLQERVQQLEAEARRQREAASTADAWEQGVERLLLRLERKDRQQQQQHEQQQHLQQKQQQLEQQRLELELRAAYQSLQEQKLEVEASSAAATVAWQMYECLVQQLVPLIAKAASAVDLLHCSNMDWLTGKGHGKEYTAGVLQGAKVLGELAQLPHVIKQQLDTKSAASTPQALNAAAPDEAAQAAAAAAAGSQQTADEVADAARAAAARVAAQKILAAATAAMAEQEASPRPNRQNQQQQQQQQQQQRQAPDATAALPGNRQQLAALPELEVEEEEEATPTPPGPPAAARQCRTGPNTAANKRSSRPTNTTNNGQAGGNSRLAGAATIQRHAACREH